MPETSEDEITKRDLKAFKQELFDELVSKKEFERRTSELATRENLEVVANQVARNTNDISEIKKDIKGIKWEVGQIREDIKSLETKLDNKFDIVLTAIDHVAREMTNMRTEKVSINPALLRHEDRLDDHDRRIKKLEMEHAS